MKKRPDVIPRESMANTFETLHQISRGKVLNCGRVIGARKLERRLDYTDPWIKGICSFLYTSC